MVLDTVNCNREEDTYRQTATERSLDTIQVQGPEDLLQQY
uniref:Uncharacterized protein n=1 Tax=Rhizophora mucronata TaxID=61149 RepID=A0A2P2NUB8_RHIMU